MHINRKHISGLITSLVFIFVAHPIFAQQVQSWDDCSVDGVPTLQCLEVVYSNLLLISSAIVLLILFLMLVYGGFIYLTSLGEASKIQKGQKTIMWALIGVAIYAGSYIILLLIDNAFLGGKGTIFKLKIPGPMDP